MSLHSATALIVATVIGVGIFTSTGFQADALPHPGAIFAVWILGGGLAMCGALCYAELGAALPEAGAEYVYLRESFGYTVAFVSAVVSLVAGFSAPIAAILKSLVRYLTYFVPILEQELVVVGFLNLNDLIALGLTWGLILIHLCGVRGGIGFNDIVTVSKVLGIIGLLIFAAVHGTGTLDHLRVIGPSFHEMDLADRLGAFSTSLIFVMFCYSGYNAASYMASEVKEPQRVLPRAILLGTFIVIVLYLGLNLFYFYGADVNELAGKVEVGLVAARYIFGPMGIGIVTIVILVTLLSAASAMTVIGPRVYYAMGRDFPVFRSLCRLSESHRVPSTALLLQGLVTSVILLTGTVDQIQQFVGIAVTLFSVLAVSAVFVLRVKRPDLPRPFKTWGYPFTPILFLVVSGSELIWNVRERPAESVLALLLVGLAGVVGWYSKHGSSVAHDDL